MLLCGHLLEQWGFEHEDYLSPVVDYAGGVAVFPPFSYGTVDVFKIGEL